ncbi:MAG: tRNA (adenosine(37)-N6)-threonylcarbamoyltransferase complex transferase subunit TsaD [Bacteroidales bacterium]|jgi:N6-L-threonylcarbamoyladenine synthase|nr:tRNA (adenosine(37)-N6)-threonylcarbamoyltransferase complex transferase subunit TsaD [Bacteroidales bacterium]
MSYILGIESSCDDTSAAILKDDVLLSNCIASQAIHEQYGGVVPEWASRAHLRNIVPVVDVALSRAKISREDLDAVAFTRGPGLLGSLLVGVSFAKSFAQALDIPLVEVNHLEGHVLSHFIKTATASASGTSTMADLGMASEATQPSFPFLCLLVSGGHTQILRVSSPFDFKILGSTIDDAAGETLDKAAKIMGLSYPGGPVIDKLATQGNCKAFTFSKPRIPEYNYSFSGLKTAFLYFLRDNLKNNPHFIEEHKADLAASLQKAVIDILMEKLVKASKDTGIKEIAIAGGVSANSLLRSSIMQGKQLYGWRTFIPPLSFTTDNAAMIAIAGYFKFLMGIFAPLNSAPYARGRY